MLSRILATGTLVSAVLAMSALPSHADESLPFGGLGAIELQNLGTVQPLHGDPFSRLTMLNTTALFAINAGVFVRNRVFGPGTGMIRTGSVHDIHLDNVQGITNIAVNTGIGSNIQQSVSVNYVIRPPAE